MELLNIISTLWRRRLWVTLAVIAAACVAVTAAYRVSLSPLGLESKSFQVGAASTQVLLDSPKSALVDLNSDLGPLASRAEVFAQFMRSGTFVRDTAKRAGVPSLTAVGPYGGSTDVNPELPAEQRADQLVHERNTYRLRFDSGSGESNFPVISIYAQAPTAKKAAALADAATDVLKDYVERTAVQADVTASARLKVQQLSEPQGGLIANDVAKKSVALTFFASLTGLLFLIVVVSGLTDGWRLQRRRQVAAQASVGPAVARNSHSADAPVERILS